MVSFSPVSKRSLRRKRFVRFMLLAGLVIYAVDSNVNLFNFHLPISDEFLTRSGPVSNCKLWFMKQNCATTMYLYILKPVDFLFLIFMLMIATFISSNQHLDRLSFLLLLYWFLAHELIKWLVRFFNTNKV